MLLASQLFTKPFRPYGDRYTLLGTVVAQVSDFRNYKTMVVPIALIAVAGVAIWPIRAHFQGQHARTAVEFSRDVRPILNQNCVACHGGVRQKNGVSFIFREEALGTGKSGRPTIVPGHPEDSEFMARLTTSDPEGRMPYHGPRLPPEQIDCCADGSRKAPSGKTIGPSYRLCRSNFPGSIAPIGCANPSTALFWLAWKRKVCRLLPRRTRRLFCGGSLLT